MSGTDLKVAQLVAAVEQSARIVGAVGPEQWGRPTPCTDWDVRALVNHAAAGLQLFDAGARGEPSSLDVYGTDVLGDDPAAAYGAAAERFCEALAAPGVGAADRMWAMAWGETPAAQAMAIAVIEFQQHGWDVARATGQAVDFDPGLVAAAREEAERMIGQFGRREGVFADEAPCPEGAAAADRLAAFLGRRL